MRRYNIKAFIVIASIIFIAPKFAYGYLDPGTGSYIIQVILAALLGIAVGVRVYWAKIKNFFKKKSNLDK